jgi:hypothetical protein
VYVAKWLQGRHSSIVSFDISATMRTDAGEPYPARGRLALKPNKVLVYRPSVLLDLAQLKGAYKIWTLHDRAILGFQSSMAEAALQAEADASLETDSLPETPFVVDEAFLGETSSAAEPG